MQNGNFRIQVAATRRIRATHKKEALERSIRIQDLEMLTIRYLNSEKLQQTLLNNSLPIVFTSAHGVEAFVQMEKAAHTRFPVRNAFVINGNTQIQTISAGFTMLGAAPDAHDLAPIIAKSSFNNLLHLTANLRRDELYTELKRQGVELTPLEVYEKTPAPAEFKKFDALMVFSPSQVDAFLEMNQLPESCPVFCIGKTTAARVSEIPHQKTIIAEHPSESGVLRKVYEYYNC